MTDRTIDRTICVSCRGVPKPVSNPAKISVRLTQLRQSQSHRPYHLRMTSGWHRDPKPAQRGSISMRQDFSSHRNRLSLHFIQLLAGLDLAHLPHCHDIRF
jgi:hypothetical protein